EGWAPAGSQRNSLLVLGRALLDRREKTSPPVRAATLLPMRLGERNAYGAGARATPRNAVFAAALTNNVGAPLKAPLYPLASTSDTSSPPPAAALPPLRVAYSDTVPPFTTAARPR